MLAKFVTSIDRADKPEFDHNESSSVEFLWN